MGFLERTGAQLMWGLHNLRHKLAQFLCVMPQRCARHWRGGDKWDRFTFDAREQAMDRYHRRFGARVFVRVYAWLQVYAWVRVCLGGGEPDVFRDPAVQQEILTEAMILSARAMGGFLCVNTL